MIFYLDNYSICINCSCFFWRFNKKRLRPEKRVSEMVQNQVTKNANDFLNDYKLLAQKRMDLLKH